MSERRSLDRATRIRVEDLSGGSIDRVFSRSFVIGRGEECEVQIDIGLVSREHAEVFFEDGCWWVRDLESTNGTFVDGERVDEVAIEERFVELQLAPDGPVLRLAVAEEKVEDDATASWDGDRAGGETSPGAGHPELQYHLARQRLVYGGFAAAVLIILLGVVGYSAIQQRRLDAGMVTQQRIATELAGLKSTAGGLFDEMRALELQIVRLETLLEKTEGGPLADQVRALQETRRRMARRYDGYIEELGIYRELGPQERLIYKMARVFNESEFSMPAGFVESVKRSIAGYWQTAAGRQRFIGAVRQAEDRGYTRYIARSLHRHGLPPHFFYLALQESNLSTSAIGPLTRWGRAKGMWQFIPKTAIMFQLNPGAYANEKMLDPRDERLDFEKSTDAAARYLRSIYGTLAQASGLLVIASYNWGEHRVAPKLDQLEDIPENPAARSYWRFLGEYRNRMPDETKDYVLKIFAAAVIGEDPALFGFDLANPLRNHLSQLD